MAVNISRSLRGDLHEGATDGSYRKVRPDTAVIPGLSEGTLVARESLDANYNYGFITKQAPLMVSPDGSVR